MDGGVLTYIRIKDAEKNPTFTNRHVKIANKAYQVDGVFYGADQEKLFETISRTILEKALHGYNCTVFAYGQTGSGKTYTMQGTEDDPGIIPRALGYLHDRCGEIKFSFVEIYNEAMTDLFVPQNQLSMREDPSEGIVVDNLCIESSSSLYKSLEFYKTGIYNKRCATTKMNENSSRSHTIFTIYLEIRDRKLVRRSKLCLVDLAGSERLRVNEPERTKETCNINKSLLCLGNIVNKLSSRDRWHVSYRDSKLTFLLKDSLGGNCRLAIIGNVCLEYEAESVSTLHFLQRSKMICNSPSINYDITGCTAEELTDAFKMVLEENQRLKDELEKVRKEGTISASISTVCSFGKIRDEAAKIKEKFSELKRIFNKALWSYFEANRREIDVLVALFEAGKERGSEGNALSKENALNSEVDLCDLSEVCKEEQAGKRPKRDN